MSNHEFALIPLHTDIVKRFELMVAALINAADIFEFYNSHRYLSSVSFFDKKRAGKHKTVSAFPCPALRAVICCCGRNRA